MDYNKTTIIVFMIALVLVMVAAVPVSALKANKSNIYQKEKRG
jgi:hypothetical protein